MVAISTLGKSSRPLSSAQIFQEQRPISVPMAAGLPLMVQASPPLAAPVERPELLLAATTAASNCWLPQLCSQSSPSRPQQPSYLLEPPWLPSLRTQRVGPAAAHSAAWLTPCRMEAWNTLAALAGLEPPELAALAELAEQATMAPSPASVPGSLFLRSII